MKEERAEELRDEEAIHALIERWAKAVRDEDFDGIFANHDPNMLMFDVPPPFLSRGLDEYRATWQRFYPCQARPITFEFDQVEITAGSDVAFATAIGHCAYLEHGETTDLKFRLTLGFRKRNGEWWVLHEHHSIPATD